jgi:hypothetical protein
MHRSLEPGRKRQKLLVQHIIACSETLSIEEYLVTRLTGICGAPAMHRFISSLYKLNHKGILTEIGHSRVGG